MNKEDNEILNQFQKNYDELMQDEKYQKYASLMEFYHKKIKNLQHELEEKDKIIDEIIEYIKSLKEDYEPYYLVDRDVRKILKILLRGKNE